MEQVIVDIPAQDEPQAWTPPALSEADAPEPDARTESAADVFFAQYAVCILLLTAVLLLRVFDRETFDSVSEAFRAGSDAPTMPWIGQLIALIESLWS